MTPVTSREQKSDTLPESVWYEHRRLEGQLWLVVIPTHCWANHVPYSRSMDHV